MFVLCEISMDIHLKNGLKLIYFCALMLPPSLPAGTSFTLSITMNYDAKMHLVPLNNRSLRLPRHYPFSLCVAVGAMCHLACAFTRQIMSPRSGRRGPAPLRKYAPERGWVCRAREKYFPCHKEPYQNVIFITSEGNVPLCIRWKSDLMWCTAACQKQCYLGQPGSPICSVF